MKPKATSTKSFAMGRPRLTKRKMPTPQEKANFVSFQDPKNDSSNSFTNSFEALRMVKENSMTGELRSHPNNKMKGGRPPKSHYSKETFAKKIYNNYASYKRLKTEKMTPKEFALRKKKLLLESRISVFDRLTTPQGQAYNKLKGAQAAMSSTSCSKFQWRRKDDEEMEDLEVHTVRVITEGSEHPVEPERPFTRLRKKTTIGTSSMPEEDPIQAIQERGKAMSFQASPRRNDDSTDEENDNLVFTSNRDPVLAKIKKQLDQREKDHISMMHTVASLTGVISRLSDQVQNMFQENSRNLHRQPPSVQAGQDEEEDEEEVLGLHERARTSAAPEPMISREEIQKIVAAQLKQSKGDALRSEDDKPYSSFHDQVAYPKGYSIPKFK